MIFKQSSNRDVNFNCVDRSFANQGFAPIISGFLVTIIHTLNHLTFFPDSVYFPLTSCTSIASFWPGENILRYVDEGHKQQQQTVVFWHYSVDHAADEEN